MSAETGEQFVLEPVSGTPYYCAAAALSLSLLLVQLLCLLLSHCLIVNHLVCECVCACFVALFDCFTPELCLSFSHWGCVCVRNNICLMKALLPLVSATHTCPTPLVCCRQDLAIFSSLCCHGAEDITFNVGTRLGIHLLLPLMK